MEFIILTAPYVGVILIAALIAALFCRWQERIESRKFAEFLERYQNSQSNEDRFKSNKGKFNNLKYK